MPLTDNIIHYWKLDGDSVDVVAADNGTDTNITYNAGNGKIVQGAGFDGTTSKITLGTAIAIPTDFTMNVWVKYTEAVGNQNIFADGNGGFTVEWQMFLTGKKIVWGYALNTASDLIVWETDNDVISDTNWHMISLTQVGTADPKFYVDGSLVASSVLVALGSNTKPTAQGSVIGTQGSTGNNFWNGPIDELGMWSRALSATEISQLYASGVGLAYPFTTGRISSLLLGR